MSIKLVAMVLDAPMKDRTEKLALIVLANYANENDVCWPSVATIARQACLERRSVQRVLKRLSEGGYITIEEGSAWGGKNLYRFHLPILLGGDPTPPPPEEGGDRGVAGGDPRVAGGATGESRGGATLESPEPLLEPSIKPKEDLFGSKPLTKRDREEAETELFNRFWELYPKTIRKADKAKTRDLYLRTIHGKRKDVDPQPTGATINGALLAYVQTSPDLQYVPAPIVWLNKCRWEAFVETGSGGGGEPLTEQQKRDREIIERSKRK